MKIQCDTTMSVLAFFPMLNIVSPAELKTAFD